MGLAVGRGLIKQRFEVHVCTTAERGYALEAWRQLDPHARLIPVASRPTRIVCVPSKLKKQLSRVLGLGQPPPPAAAMPLAIIVDDRLEVLDHFILNVAVLRLDTGHAVVVQLQPAMFLVSSLFSPCLTFFWS
jgi:hypothetical protein